MALRTEHHARFEPARLVERKGGTRTTVCLPARDEASTVGVIVERIVADLVDRHPLVDEVLVVDDHSTDGTAEAAAAAGAKVVVAEEVLPELELGPGKGQALWKSLFASEGDVVVWCDADLRDFSPAFVVGLLGPLLTDASVAFVKGFYARPDPQGTGGGRVTELVARPALSLLHPHLATLRQPLSGEFGGRRTLLEQLPFVCGYGVDLGLVLDVVATVGGDAMAEVDLGVRQHRNRPLDQLTPQAAAVLQVALRRAGHPDAAHVPPGRAELRLPGAEPVPIDGRDLPPLVDVPAYRVRRGLPPA